MKQTPRHALPCSRELILAMASHDVLETLQ